MAQPYEILDHTADVILRVRGADRPSLFRAALEGLYAVIGRMMTVDAGEFETVAIEINAGDRENLFHDWLAEALYYFDARGALFCDVRIVELTEASLRAEARAAAVDWHASEPEREVKAVTYHGLRVEEAPDGWVATVVLDI
jgi:SHS2 domain-containing protein